MSRRAELEMAVRKIRERRVKDVQIVFPDRRCGLPEPGDSLLAEAFLSLLPKRTSVAKLLREQGIPVPSGPGGRPLTGKERIAAAIRRLVDATD